MLVKSLGGGRGYNGEGASVVVGVKLIMVKENQLGRETKGQEYGQLLKLVTNIVHVV